MISEHTSHEGTGKNITSCDKGFYVLSYSIFSSENGNVRMHVGDEKWGETNIFLRKSNDGKQFSRERLSQ